MASLARSRSNKRNNQQNRCTVHEVINKQKKQTKRKKWFVAVVAKFNTIMNNIKTNV